MQLVSNQSIECRDEICNLVWANTYIPWGVIHNSIGIVVRNAEALIGEMKKQARPGADTGG